MIGASTLRKFRRHWLAAAVGSAALIAGSMGFVVGERRLAEERVVALRDIDTSIAVLTAARKNRDERSALDARTQRVVNKTLGPSLEIVDSEVRRRLNRACEELGMSEFSVTTGTTTIRGTPAKKEFRRPEERPLRDEPDFVEVQATVSASGSAAMVYQLLFRIDVEPWMKRIESVRLDPTADGASIKTNIKLTTIFLPGRVAAAPLVVDPLALASAQRFAELFGSNPFRIPPPPIAPVAAVANSASDVGLKPQSPAAVGAPLPVTNPASPFPYGEWQLTGVVEGPSGPEAWLRHLPSGALLTLKPGSSIGELIFRSVEYDSGVFDGPGGTCRVQIGSNLTQRASAAG
jgi:hypothetical protein